MKKRPVLFDYLFHAIYLTIYGAVKYLPSPIGDYLRLLIIGISGCTLSRNCRFYEGSTLWYPYRIKFGKKVTVNEWVYLSGFGGLIIGDYVSIGHRTTIITSDHDCKSGVLIKNQPLISKQTIIGSDVFIGANCTIMGGVKIGDGAVIGAGAVVTKDVGENEVVAGVPAKFIRFREK